jgi:hypothetical protein
MALAIPSPATLALSSIRAIPPNAVTMPFATQAHRGSAIRTGNSSFNCKDITHPEVKQAAQVVNAWPIENLEEVRKRLTMTGAKILVDVPIGKDDSTTSPYELAFVHPGALGLFETSDGTRDGLRSKIRYFTKFNQFPSNLPDPKFIGVVDENAAAPTGSTITCHGIRPTWNTSDGDLYPGDDVYWDYPRTEYDINNRVNMPVARVQAHLPQTGARARLVKSPWRNGTSAYPEQLRQYFTGKLTPGDNTASSFACLREGMDWLRMVIPADMTADSVLTEQFLDTNDMKSAIGNGSADQVKSVFKNAADQFASKYAPDSLFPGQEAFWSQTLRDIAWKRLDESDAKSVLNSATPAALLERIFLRALVQTLMVMSAITAQRHYEVLHDRYVGQVTSFAAQGEMVHILLK